MGKKIETTAFPEFYFETHFKLEGKKDNLPPSFSIITAYATTGEKWTDKENLEADVRLASELTEAGVPHWRMTGYSPATGHSEPGWATPLSAEEACEIGRRYFQHAVFIVTDGILSVMLCENGDHKIMGPMAERLEAC